MKESIKKVLNIYVISALIGLFAVLYMISFVILQMDINNGSSLKMHKEQMAKQKKQSV